MFDELVQHDSRQHSVARLCALLCDTAAFIACKRYDSVTSTAD